MFTRAQAEAKKQQKVDIETLEKRVAKLEALIAAQPAEAQKPRKG